MQTQTLIALASVLFVSSCIYGGALTEEQAAQVHEIFDTASASLREAGSVSGNPVVDLSLTALATGLATYKGIMLKRDSARRARQEPVTVAEARAK